MKFSKKIFSVFKSKYGKILKIIILFTALYVLGFWSIAYIQASLFFPGLYVNTLETTQEMGAESLPEGFEKIPYSYKEKKYVGYFLNQNSDTTVYYFHGNGGDIRFFTSDLVFIKKLGYNVLAYEIPGYGENQGFPTESEIFETSKIFYDTIQKKYQISPENTIVWGYSIGTGIATKFSTSQKFAGLVLLAGYTSFYDISREKIGFSLQKFFFLKNSFQTRETLAASNIPLFISHGKQDTLLPYRFAQENFDVAKTRDKKIIFYDQGDHYNLLTDKTTQTEIENFLKYKTFDAKKISDYKLQEQQKENQQKLQEFLSSLDTDSNDSYTKYVDPNHPYTPIGYVPKDLSRPDSRYVADWKGDLQVREIAASALEKMAKDFYETFGEKIAIVSSYRSYEYQAGIKSRGCLDSLCANAGYSEHQSGLAVDVWEASSQQEWNNSTKLMKYYDWLDKNAYKYGFSNSYKNGIAMDGYAIEPWHWRYLGEELATYLHENNITYAQYYQQIKAPSY